MALKSKLPTKAISSCCGKYRLKPDDRSCFPKVGTTQARLCFQPSDRMSYYLGSLLHLHCLMLLGSEWGTLLWIESKKMNTQVTAVFNTTNSQVECLNKDFQANRLLLQAHRLDWLAHTCSDNPDHSKPGLVFVAIMVFVNIAFNRNFTLNFGQVDFAGNFLSGVRCLALEAI